MTTPISFHRLHYQPSRAIRLIILAVLLCDSARGDFDFKSVSETDQLALFQGADLQDGRLLLTPNAKAGFGSAWYRERQAVGDGFEMSFHFRILRPEAKGKTSEGEGFAFVIQNNRITGLVCSPSSYYSIPNSLAVEFDTRCSPGTGDPNGNHISIQTMGENPNSAKHVHSLGLTVGIPDLRDGNAHTVKIEYRKGQMRIFLDRMHEPVLTAKVELSTLLELDQGKAWVGFAAGTRSSGERHEILTWSFRSGGAAAPATTATATTLPASRPSFRDFAGKVMLVELGDPLEDPDQLKMLRNGLKRLGEHDGIILWVDSPNGDRELVRDMTREIQRFSGPKIVLVGGGRYGGAFGNLLPMLSAFDVVMGVPGAVTGTICNVSSIHRNTKPRTAVLPSTTIDPDRLRQWSDPRMIDSKTMPLTLNQVTGVQDPQDALAQIGMDKNRIELLGPIVLSSRMNEKLKSLDAQLTRLPGMLEKCIATQVFWSNLDRRPNSVAESLDNLILNARRSVMIVEKVLAELAALPQAGRFLKTEGIVTQEWREDYFTHHLVIKEKGKHQAKSSSSKSRPTGKVRGRKSIRIELYYGGDPVRLQNTLEWLENAVTNYKRLRKDLKP